MNAQNTRQTLDVYLHNQRVGHLHSERGTLSFNYLANYLKQPNALKLSAALPLEAKSFDHTCTSPFFSGLLPDEGVRHRLAKYLRLSEKNVFALLKAIGGECAGAISLHPTDSSPEKLTTQPTHRVLSAKEADDVLTHLSQTPFLAKEDNIRISGAGAQDKLMISFVNDQIAIPTGNTPSTHIIKPAIQNLDQTVHNEFFCMRLAKTVGLNAPAVNLLWIQKKPYYVVERYDRYTDQNQRLKRIHQEDFCQTMGIPPEIKYENEGGPSILNCIAQLDQRIQSGHMPSTSKQAIFQAIIFNFLIGNGDAHGKNFSILYEGQKEILAPCYDLLCTMVYTNPFKARMAMKLSGQSRFQFVTSKHWYALGKALGFQASFTKKEIMKLSQHVAKAAPALAKALNQDPETTSTIYDKINDIIQQQCLHINRINDA